MRTFSDEYYAELERDIRRLVAPFRGPLTPDDLSWVDLFLDHAEYGLALEVFVERLVERRLSVGRNAVAAVGALVARMDLAESYVERLRPLTVDDAET